MKTALATLAIENGRDPGALWNPNPYEIGDVFKLCSLSQPTMTHYARRIGADFHIFSQREWPELHLYFAKFQIRHLFDQYDRILFVDADVLIRGDAPNIFDVVPYGSLGACNEGPRLGKLGLSWINELWGAAGGVPDGWTWDGVYFNAGVLVVDRTHIPLLQKPYKTLERVRYGDQGVLNLYHQQRKFPWFDLPTEFNYMAMCRPNVPLEEICQEAHFAHISAFRIEQRVQMMTQILREWKSTFRR